MTRTNASKGPAVRWLAAWLMGLALIGAQDAVFGAAPALAFDCQPPPNGQPDIKAMGYYTDAAKSIVDPKLFAENRALTKPLDQFVARVADMSDQYAGQKDAEAGACAIAWLDRWSQDHAMLGEMVHVNNDQADYLRQWSHAGLAVSYLKAKSAADAGQRVRIEAWLQALAVQNMAYWDNPKKSRNNHYYWTGVGVMATAVAVGDAKLLATARAIYRKGVDDIGDDGALPLEMKRGERAFHYHNYALDPLVLIAEMARRTGEDWYAYRDHRIDLLADRVAAGFRDPSWFAQRAGTAQVDLKPSSDTGWVEFYRLRAARPERFDALHAAGPYHDARAGGDLTMLARIDAFAAK